MPAYAILRSSRPPYTLSTDPAMIDLGAVHAFLSTCYWSPGIARERVERAVANSLNFGVYDTSSPRPGDQGRPSLVGFARVVTDYASFAYLCDVFVLEPHRGRGLSRWMMDAAVSHPALRGVRRFCLLTRDAHGLYAKYGFAPLPDPSRYMEKIDRESYKTP